METTKVYLLLTDTGSMLTKMIKLYTKKPYNHASIVFDGSLKEVYSFGRKNPRNPFIGGFVNEDVRQGVFTNARCAIYSFEVTLEQKKKMMQFINRIESEKHLYRYNLLGLITFIINKPYERKHAFFCSQFIANVLSEGNVIEFQKPSSLITPYDLQMLPNLKLEYEGQLAELFELHTTEPYYMVQ